MITIELANLKLPLAEPFGTLLQVMDALALQLTCVEVIEVILETEWVSGSRRSTLARQWASCSVAKFQTGGSYVRDFTALG